MLKKGPNRISGWELSIGERRLVRTDFASRVFLDSCPGLQSAGVTFF
jgi:hypothetical protein